MGISKSTQDVEVLLFKTIEGETIQLLLAGNDTQCFTTWQYGDAKDVVLERLIGVKREVVGVPKPGTDILRSQLQGCGLVEEVKPDVWCLKSAAQPKEADRE